MFVPVIPVGLGLPADIKPPPLELINKLFDRNVNTSTSISATDAVTSKLSDFKNLEIIKSDLDNNLLYLKGSIPGSKNTEVLVKKAVKNVSKLTIKEKIEVIEKQKKSSRKEKK